ncbi:MAG: Sec-independent protein translocase TatA [Chloroflexi bacterium 13_1_40CM_4_68_4]|nr:MAG: Sec-independent protein translocase TatA [Chloroflexi bacterium 13_1_40CM_4_68_4]
MPNLGAPEIILILAIVLIVFGAGKLPDVMSQLGRGVREFRDSASGKDEDKTVTKTTTEPKP